MGASMQQIRADLDKAWRQSEFVVSYPAKGSYPTGTLHRSKCRTLSAETRVGTTKPSSVHAIELERFRVDANSSQIGNAYRVCQICCSDIEVKGRRMEAPKPAKKLRVVLDLTRDEKTLLVATLTDVKIPFFQQTTQAVMDKLLAALKAARVTK